MMSIKPVILTDQFLHLNTDANAHVRELAHSLLRNTICIQVEGNDEQTTRYNVTAVEIYDDYKQD
jgi:hypothetical protein